jgi:aryl-phospho-beta-D-glucosidase BglC (GH1 family)
MANLEEWVSDKPVFHKYTPIPLMIRILVRLTFALVFFAFTGCEKEDLTAVSVSKEKIEFSEEGSTAEFSISTNAASWEITSNLPWIQLSKSAGTSGSATIEVTALTNPDNVVRTGNLTLLAGNAAPVEIKISQKGQRYPNYNTSPIPPDASGMTSSAMELAAKIKLGWNVGNSLEAIGSETAWGNPLITPELIQLVKRNGFNAIRIPCSWNQYMENSATAKIKTEWLDRVKKVVQFSVDEGMYVILNIHWDGGWLENNVTPAKQAENKAKQKAFWEQIATHLRDFDEHLMFAGTNEPNVDNAAQMAVLDSYLQTFVDAVRSTGGRNRYRVLVVQGPYTDIEKTNSLMNSLPKDLIANRMMAEIHYYTPFQFSLMEADANWGNMFYYWGKDFHSQTDPTRNATWGEEATVVSMMRMMKTKFVDKGIPVILGEYAVGRRLTLTGANLDLHLASRAFYLKYVTQQAKANGILPFYWDAGGTGNNGSGLFDRKTNTVFDRQALNALIEGSKN